MRPKFIFMGLCTLLLTGTLFYACSNDFSFKRNVSKTGVYELNLQNIVSQRNPDTGEKEDLLRKWRLDMPRKYIRSYYGQNGVPAYDPVTKKNNDFSMTIFTIIDTEAMTLLPNPNVVNGYHLPNQLVMRLGNGRPVKKVRDVESIKTSCITSKILFEDIGGYSPSPGNNCGKTMKLCNLHMFVEGWPVSLALDKPLYDADPQPYCNLARDFLDDLTIERDSLFEPVK